VYAKFRKLQTQNGATKERAEYGQEQFKDIIVRHTPYQWDIEPESSHVKIEIEFVDNSILRKLKRKRKTRHPA